MLSIEWFDGEVPSGLPLRQVYGVIFTEDGRMLLKVDLKPNGKKVYALAGGTPEDYDTDRVATLVRELKEEVNTSIKSNVELVGYQLITGDNDRPPYAQVRMTAMIDSIGEVLPDPDNGETYERLLTTPSRAIELLKWGDVGERLINRAVEIAKEKFNLQLKSTVEENV